MKLDYVHDIQRAFRTLITAFSFPGTCHSISEEAVGIDADMGLYPSFILLALMLLDSEVRFAVVGEQKTAHEELLSRLTYSRPTGIAEADFIFVPDSSTDAAGLILAARGGNLINPELGASIILGSDILESGGADSPLLLQGPGIKSVLGLSVDRHPSWLGARAEKNKEFPLGVDLIFLTSDGKLAALPRTTAVSAASGGC